MLTCCCDTHIMLTSSADTSFPQKHDAACGEKKRWRRRREEGGNSQERARRYQAGQNRVVYYKRVDGALERQMLSDHNG